MRGKHAFRRNNPDIKTKLLYKVNVNSRIMKKFSSACFVR